MGKPVFSGTIMKVLGLKPWENRMRVHADQMNGRNLGYSQYPELYNHWQNIPQYQHHCRTIQSHDGRLHHLSADDRHRAWLHHHDRARRYEEEQLARRYGRHPRRHRHPRRLHPRHNIAEDCEDEYDEDTDEDYDIDEHTGSASSMSYERIRHGHDRGHGLRSHGGRRLHGRHPPYHGNPSHGGWNGRMDYGGYPESGFYGHEFY